MVVEAFLVVSVASFHLSIMPWRSRSKQLVNDLQSCTLYVHGMNHLGFPEMGEFTSIVCLDNLWEVSEVGDCPANEIHSAGHHPRNSRLLGHISRPSAT